MKNIYLILSTINSETKSHFQKVFWQKAVGMTLIEHLICIHEKLLEDNVKETDSFLRSSNLQFLLEDVLWIQGELFLKFALVSQLLRFLEWHIIPILGPTIFPLKYLFPCRFRSAGGLSDGLHRSWWDPTIIHTRWVEWLQVGLKMKIYKLDFLLENVGQAVMKH